jgi:hypothetical protein
VNKLHTLWLVAVGALVLTACGLSTSLPIVTPSPGEQPLQPTADIASTPAPPLPTPTPSPAVPLSPTPAAPPTPGYEIESEQSIGGYTVRLWQDPANDYFGKVLILAAPGQPDITIGGITRIEALTGNDITGEGNPDLVVELFTGGAHCCFSTIVYDLGPTPTKVLETPLSNCSGRFENLDADNIPEYHTCDDLFAYRYCSYAASPMADVVLQYQAGVGYVPASPRFPQIYADEIITHTTWAQNAQPAGWGEWDGTSKCAVLPIVLDYMYMGQPALAWGVMDQLYNFPDKYLFWAEIVRSISQSPLYTPGNPLPAVSLPGYYMLNLAPGCSSGNIFNDETIELLLPGQATCDPAVLRRDTLWLDGELRLAGLLTQDERVEITPQDYKTGCQLEIVGLADQARIGTIYLDVSQGFPGQVYRVDSAEGPHWRLRGDLTWEQIP